MKDHDDANLSRAVSNALSAASISRQRWELLFAGIIPLERQFAVLLNRELELIRRVRSQDAEIESLRRERVNLVNRLASEEAAKNAAQDDMSRLQQALNEANEKYQLLDQHWRAVSDQSLKKQSGSFRERICHEVQEALLSLERQTPNVSMALLRLKRIDEIVSNSGSREE
jgi:chromosome segregation ATPase